MQTYKVTVDDYKTTRWYNDKDQLHRLDGPAVEWSSGDKEWYVEGKCHRLDGPARVWASGSKEWFVNGKLHRLDGPAIEYTNGHKSWYVNGKFHRLDGPAIEHTDGYKVWYVEGKHLTEAEFNEYIKSKKTITYTVSHLTKPWALKGTESVIRALSGKALDGFDVKIKINKKPKPKKRGNNKKSKKL